MENTFAKTHAVSHSKAGARTGMSPIGAREMLIAEMPELEKLLKAENLSGLTGRIIKPRMFSTINNLYVLRRLFAEIKPERTLEIGIAFGASAVLFSLLHKAHSSHPEGAHQGIDPFQISDFDGCAVKFLKDHGLESIFRFHYKPSGEVLPTLLTNGNRFQLIYVDGSHLFEDVFVDFFYSHRLLEPGGIIAFDDTQDPHVLKVVRFIRNNYSEFYEELSPYDYQFGHPLKLKVKSAVARLTSSQHLTIFRKTHDGVRKWNARFNNF
ncbi:MAG: class I SAM-dependent methyltransferase [Verrucomicrobiae bacterium]